MTTFVFARAAAVAPHALAARAGRDVLEAGGDAIEAMVAMAAMMAVVYPHMNGLAGDGVWLIREPSGRLRCLDACGYAGTGATIAAYRAAGYDELPARGPKAALTVPGAVDGWRAALDLSRALGGRLPLADLMAPAARRAREGYAVSAAEARTRPGEAEALLAAPGFAETFLIEGRWPKAAELRRAEPLAETLDYLGRAGLDDFYRGDIGREFALDLERLGTPVTRHDLVGYRAAWREPLTLALREAALANAPPPTQGVASLALLGIFERLGAARAESFAHVHGLIEAFKRVAPVRDRICVDAAAAPEWAGAALAAAALDREAAAISKTRAAPFPARQEAGDTVWMAAADARGLIVSYIQSIYWEYGSGCVATRIGAHVHNRGRAFSLDPASRNALAPGRRPFHTLNPALAVSRDGSVVAYGAMGGEGQPQFQAQVFTRLALGAEPGEAVERPRFLLGRSWGAPSATLKLEPRFDPDLVRALEQAGHVVEVLPEPYSDACGHAGVLLRSPNGALRAAHDPRADGEAAGV